MPSKRVQCPKCGKVLSVPGGLRAVAVRCGACRTPFRLPEATGIADDTIAGWLSDEPEVDDLAAQTVTPALDGSGPVPTPEPGAPGEKAAAEEGLRVVSFDNRGVLFEFPSDLLRSQEFRCAIPRCCAHCLARAHLSAHVVIFTSQLRDSISLEAEHKAGHLSIPQEELRSLEGAAMLAQLPQVPNVPPPADLPMPYWVCDMCSGAGSISGQIQVNTSTGRGICRMFIRNLRLAAAFVAATGAERRGQYRKLQEFIEHMEEDRWEALPSVVRHRVEQWFRPKMGEKFLAYVPDRAFVRTEDGMNGLAISDRRLVWHHPPRHQELLRETPLEIQIRAERGNEVAALEATGFKRRSILLDRQGMMLFRRALSRGSFKAEWK